MTEIYEGILWGLVTLSGSDLYIQTLRVRIQEL